MKSLRPEREGASCAFLPVNTVNCTVFATEMESDEECSGMAQYVLVVSKNPGKVLQLSRLMWTLFPVQNPGCRSEIQMSWFALLEISPQKPSPAISKRSMSWECWLSRYLREVIPAEY